MELLSCFKGLQKKTPIWFMRQAGRYLPEYRKSREQCPDFIKFCLNFSLIQEATLQPLKRFDLDAAIIFSDILVIPYALGQKTWFEGGVGPQLESYKESLQWETDLSILSPLYEGIKSVRKELASDKALIGFSGSPYTLACYMIEGKTSRTFGEAKRWAFENPERMDSLLSNLAQVTTRHLVNQLKAGCNVIQIFDSWASTVPDAYVEKWLIFPLQFIVKEIRKSFSRVPIIAFPKDLGDWIPEYVSSSEIDGVSVSSSERIEKLLSHLPDSCVIQGGLDPYLLVAGGKAMEEDINRLIKLTKDRRYIFNLGHGIVPETPIENVQRAINLVRERGNIS